MRALTVILMLCASNVFMTLAWYGHLRFKDMEWGKSLGLFAIILISWAIALVEYSFQVPANRLGFRGNGGPFSLMQLKIVQEALSIGIFLLFALLLFKTERIAWNHAVAFALIILAVFFAFLKK
ncbi:DMT family protein [Parapedobacter lycopersici]|uniref:DMT family protein n=1 Tax=Parapedobacter lycopersici TaxID=1864939 RepID=UPI00214D8AD4|nr:DMT family protein [Parapedobacter lycopersici]